jgi:hypothetical protein
MIQGTVAVIENTDAILEFGVFLDVRIRLKGTGRRVR